MKKCHQRGKCPVCGGEDLDYEEIELDGDTEIYPFTCSECGAKGREVYELNYVETYEVE